MLSQTHLYPFSAAAAQSTDLEHNADTEDTNLLVAVACKLVSYCPYRTKLAHCKSIFKTEFNPWYHESQSKDWLTQIRIFMSDSLLFAGHLPA
jgi:hypothetical protein